MIPVQFKGLFYFQLVSFQENNGGEYGKVDNEEEEEEFGGFGIVINGHSLVMIYLSYTG